ncbi:MAG: 3-deoxy-manno-octulosonate cytidylyltransferase [Rhodobacteraceae bacterium]|nr:3-deoxy-manno-octulosonate cytidylyltransferase [Paracoccaceae bacterium]MCY4197103.1 3-deoxy-manno-octulosonate cytidylyltransferase [Paracoccaceae bacterium]
MQVLGVIPSRFASSRFPGKPLEPLAGCTGIRKSLVCRSWEAAAASKAIDRLVVATDDIRIREEVESFGGECLMTSSACGNGTERCALAFEQFGDEFDIVVNFQGDAPLTPDWFVDELVDAMRNCPDAVVATPVIRCNGAALRRFVDDCERGMVGATTVVFDSERRALYFSKQIIPWTAHNYSDEALTPVYHHVGLYAYTLEALSFYASLKPSTLERQEGLEQLRFLENDVPMTCVEVDGKGRDFWEVNNPDDIARVEQGLMSAAIT